MLVGDTMKILISGSSGLIGSVLVDYLHANGHEVIRLVRPESRQHGKVIQWDPSAGKLNGAALEDFDAVVHLAGANIGAKRWTPARKAVIRESRIASTRLLSCALARLQNKPRVLACASAVGYYGDRGEELLDEESASGDGFLAELCREWEQAAQAASDAGIRVVHLRFGLVLSADGGALARMLPLIRLGLGGRLGSGRQYVSWIALDDAVSAIHHCLTCESLSGPVNIVSPHPVTNREFTRTLGKVLKRPTFFTVPRPALRMMLGEIADELLASTSVQPKRLLATDFRFQYPELEAALRHLLG
jgi:hypothetical protein